MLDVESARTIILEHCQRLPAGITALTSAALNQILADDILADTDSPPFAKALMDGYAVRSADCATADSELSVIEDVPAGAMPMKAVGPGQATRIFTGAPLPEGSDAVVKQEHTQRMDATVNVQTVVHAGQHMLAAGAEVRAGAVMVPAGTAITPTTFGLFAAAGKTAVPAYPQPKLGVLVTGDELIEANMKPMGAQIRNTNGPMLVALGVRAGTLPRYLGIARDDAMILKSMLNEGLATSHILLVVGGTSVGEHDLVPQVLTELGVTIHVQQVRMKPGKPLLFGTKGRTLVFGLPGNPVSAFVGFELFVKPAINVLRGRGAGAGRLLHLPLTEPLTANNDRPTYHPAQVLQGEEQRSVKALPWLGSADLRALLHANGLIVLPEGPVNFAAGTRVPVLFTHG